MKAAILKDENTELDILTDLLHEAHVQVVATFHSIAEVAQYLTKDPAPNLFFIDLNLMDENCLEVEQAITLNCFVVFMTRCNSTAWKHLQHPQFDFLKMPFEKEDVRRVISRQKRIFKHVQYHAVIPNGTYRASKSKPYKSRLLIKLGDWFTSINTEEIAYVYTNDKLKYIRTFANKDHLIDANLEELEQQLDPHQFHRVNRQFLVNFKALDKILAWFDGKIKITLNPPAHEDVIISRLKAAEFKRWLDE